MAAGLPVVSVDLPEVQRYENLIKIAKGAEEFVENIECCLRTENREGKTFSCYGQRRLEFKGFGN